MKEIWKPVKGYEDLYEVSNFGKIKGKTRNKILKPKINKFGYECVTLSKHQKLKYCFVHRIVVETFIEEIMDKLQVNHKNGIKTDNTLENLEICTASENVLHSFRFLNRKNSFLGKKHTEETKEKIRKAMIGKTNEGHSHIYITINGIEYKGVRKASKDLGINRTVLRKNITNKNFIFIYKDKEYIINSIK